MSIFERVVVSAASQRVLQIPELVGLIIEELATMDPNHLRHAALVNSLWADSAFRLYWQRPPLKALAAVPLACRYALACNIRALAINSGSDFKNFVQGCSKLSFPRLQQLDIGDISAPDIGRKQTAWLVRQLVSPRLTHFSYNGRHEQWLDALALLCGPGSQLQELRVDGADIRADPLEVVRLLESCPASQLVTMVFTDGHDAPAPVPLPLLEFFARLPRLRRLSLEKRVDTAALQALQRAVPLLPFPALQRLHVAVESDAVPLLVSAAPRVTDLSLDVDDVEARCHVMLPALASLRALRSLRLQFFEFVLLRADELLALRSLTALRHLELLPSDKAVQSYSLDDSHVAQLVAAIGRHLCVLKLLVTAPKLTVESLRSIGEHCPGIEQLTLCGNHALDQLGVEGRRLFPALTALQIDGAHVEVAAATDVWDDDE
jgi:hypothetical protein